MIEKELQVFKIAETRTCHIGMSDFLRALQIENWKTDARSSAEKLVEIGGKLCYMSFDTKLNSNLTMVGGRDNFHYIQDGIIKTRHGSVIEHASVTFILLNVSRVLTHELVRHRAGTAFSQLSGRYVRTDEVEMSECPSIIKDNPEAHAIYQAAVVSSEKAAQEMVKAMGLAETKDFTYKKKATSAIRRILGNGQANHIMFTANHRALRHIIEMRTNAGAEEEIRKCFSKIFEIVKVDYEALYADAVVTEVDGLPQISFAHQKA